MGTHEEKAEIKTDRRALRSKRLILEAYRELILEKDHKKISVTDIVERADVGRATFYAHFEDKDALERYLFSQLMTQMEKEIQISLEESDTLDSPYQILVPSLALFRIAQDKHKWFKLNAETPTIGLGMLVKPLVIRMETKLRAMDIPPSKDGISTRQTGTFLISALIALLIDWVLADMPESPEKMDEIYQALAEPTLNRLLGA